MKVDYYFANGEHSEVEVSEELAAEIKKLDLKESSAERNNRRHCYSYDFGLEMGIQYEQCSDIETFEEPAKEELLHLALRELDDDGRQILIDYYFHHITQEEMSKKYGISQQAVSKRIRAAEKKLKKVFEKWL